MSAEKYRKKYGLGLLETNNSVNDYNTYLKNFEKELSIEKLIKEFLERKKKIKILDIGCGNGGALKEIKENFKERVITAGIDLIKPEFMPGEFVCGSFLEKNLPQNCDLVVSFKTLHEIGNPEKVIEKVIDCLANGGKAILSFRIMKFVGTKLQWEGEMNKEALEFLRKILEEKKIQGVKISGKENVVYMQGFFAEEGRPQTVKFTDGVTIVIQKPLANGQWNSK